MRLLVMTPTREVHKADSLAITAYGIVYFLRSHELGCVRWIRFQ